MELLVLLIVAALIVGGVALYRRHAIGQRQAEERAALETQLATQDNYHQHMAKIYSEALCVDHYSIET